MAPLDINRVVEEASTVVEHPFRLERVRVERDPGSDIPMVVGDEEKLKQAVVNLLNNAFDAIGADGLITISTSFEMEPDEVLISVADTGEGVPPERMDRIFDPFFTTKGVGKGTGLGLSVTFGIVKDHGGTIQVRSPLPSALLEKMGKRGPDAGPTRGAVFTIRLPAKGPQAEAQKEEANGNDSRAG